MILQNYFIFISVVFWSIIYYNNHNYYNQVQLCIDEYSNQVQLCIDEYSKTILNHTYINHNITNIDSPKLNNEIYNIINNKYKFSFDDIFHTIYMSEIKTTFLSEFEMQKYYEPYDKHIDNMGDNILDLTYDIKFNTSRYYETKKLIKQDKLYLGKLRSAINKINKKYYDNFIQKYYNVSFCNNKSKKPLWMSSNIRQYRQYRYDDMIQKFDMDTFNLNLIHLLHEYV